MLSHVTKHYVLDGEWEFPPPPPQLPKNAQGYWDRYGFCQADEAIVAIEGEQLIGFFRYSFEKRLLHARGTWVAPSHRRQGLATRMWEKALRGCQSQKGPIQVVTVTRAGTAFVRSLTLSNIKNTANHR